VSSDSGFEDLIIVILRRVIFLGRSRRRRYRSFSVPRYQTALPLRDRDEAGLTEARGSGGPADEFVVRRISAMSAPVLYAQLVDNSYG